MRSLVGEAVDLVLYRGTVTRPQALDDSRIHGAAIQPAADDVVCLFIGVGDPAWQLPRMHVCRTQHGKYRHRIQIAALLLHHGEIDRAAVNTWWRAGFQPSLG